MIVVCKNKTVGGKNKFKATLILPYLSITLLIKYVLYKSVQLEISINRLSLKGLMSIDNQLSNVMFSLIFSTFT